MISLALFLAVAALGVDAGGLARAIVAMDRVGRPRCWRLLPLWFAHTPAVLIVAWSVLSRRRAGVQCAHPASPPRQQLSVADFPPRAAADKPTPSARRSKPKACGGRQSCFAAIPVGKKLLDIPAARLRARRLGVSGWPGRGTVPDARRLGHHARTPRPAAGGVAFPLKKGFSG